MSTYVMSDLHGNYEAYIKMLEKIDFKDSDMLYILGDVLDRGPNPIKIVLDLMEGPNIEVIAGNHCLMACECFPHLLEDIQGADLAKKDIEAKVKCEIYLGVLGGRFTINELQNYDKDTKQEIVDYISKFKLYDEIEVAGKTFVLVHAGLGKFRADKKLCEYDSNELVNVTPDYEKKYYDDKYVITGHTPTMKIKNNLRPGYIYQANNHIAIDCGQRYPGGRLGCLRLDDMKEFYIHNISPDDERLKAIEEYYLSVNKNR